MSWEEGGRKTKGGSKKEERERGGYQRRVRFEVYTAVTMKNAVFWDVTQSGSCKNQRFGGM
jgi:hypothetical protein